MPSTRSGRSNTGSSPAQKTGSATNNNNKRKADAISPSSKDSKSERPAKEQKTIEETLNKGTETDVKLPNVSNGDQAASDHEKQSTLTQNGTVQNGLPDATEKQDGSTAQNGHAESKEDTKDVEMKYDPKEAPNSTSSNANEGSNSQSAAQEDEQPRPEQDEKAKSAQPAATDESNNAASQNGDEPKVAPTSTSIDGDVSQSKASTQNNAVQEDGERKAAMPSNILEKGIIYFFTRGRVDVDDPGNVQDLQRSFFVLRPIPQGGKLTDGGVQDAGNNRLFALPKKVWPKSGNDRFMVFVEKAKVSMSKLKEEFFQGSEYTTQTVGVRHTPPVMPIGEGVYAITTTGGGQGTTHLAYMLTIPNEPGQLQQDVGLKDKGSFVLSLKNPKSSGPSYASLPEKPDYPRDFIEEFRGRGWMPVHPKHLDYANAQLLLIGEDFESSNNLEAKPEDKQDDKKETPGEELQKLEDEDEHRAESLKGDDTIFVDLGISKKEYSGVQTTW